MLKYKIQVVPEYLIPFKIRIHYKIFVQDLSIMVQRIVNSFMLFLYKRFVEKYVSCYYDITQLYHICLVKMNFL